MKILKENWQKINCGWSSEKFLQEALQILSFLFLWTSPSSPASPPSPPCLTSSVWLPRLALQQNNKKKTRDGGEETSAGLYKYLVLVSSIRPHTHLCNVKWCSSETSSDTLLYYTVCFSVCGFMSVCVSAAAIWALREDVHPKATPQQLPKRERKELMPNIKTHTYTQTPGCVKQTKQATKRAVMKLSPATARIRGAEHKAWSNLPDGGRASIIRFMAERGGRREREGDVIREMEGERRGWVEVKRLKGISSMSQPEDGDGFRWKTNSWLDPGFVLDQNPTHRTEPTL